MPTLDLGQVMGPQGPVGPKGDDGGKGDPGAVFTPTVSSDGVISWTNNGGLANPESVNIKGPTGNTGATGPQGPVGPKGATGATGPQGAKGATGAQGPAGKSAYQYAVDGGYTGTEAQFKALMADAASKTYVEEAVSGAIGEEWTLTDDNIGGGSQYASLQTLYANVYKRNNGLCVGNITATLFNSTDQTLTGYPRIKCYLEQGQRPIPETEGIGSTTKKVCWLQATNGELLNTVSVSVSIDCRYDSLILSIEVDASKASIDIPKGTTWIIT